jgi:hypothetical protein
MSVYDASHTAEGDSEVTSRVKQSLINEIQHIFQQKGFKTWIKEECPALFDLPYTADVGVLFRSKTEFDFYHFFIIEIDGYGHATKNKDRKERIRDDAFFNFNGIPTIRIPLRRLSGKDKPPLETLVREDIWNVVRDTWIITPMVHSKKDERNKEFAIKLKENVSMKCKACDHPPHHHTLTGCNYRQTNKAKMKCYCTEPYFISNA